VSAAMSAAQTPWHPVESPSLSRILVADDRGLTCSFMYTGQEKRVRWADSFSLSAPVSFLFVYLFWFII
jgi:hypothetical protein